MDRSDVLFVGWGGLDGVSHYRTILPARTMGAEWVVFDMTGKPIGGEGVRKTHRVIVVQNCWYDWQLRIIRKMKSTGAIVLFNCDDWIKGIGRRQGSHGHADMFRNGKLLKIHQQIWDLCDGAIVSTQWLADKARMLTDNICVARNGIDPKRYQTWMDVERDMGLVIGWAGGTGHRDALSAISGAVSRVVNDYPDVSLWIVGQDETDVFECDAFHVEWSDMYLYPAKLACFDINLAPALDDDFYRGKSQLRLYEAMTLGTPSIVHPMYDEVGAAGYTVENGEDWGEALEMMIRSPKEMAEMRENALSQAKDVTIEARIGEWTNAIDTLSN